ncbi:MAG: cysteine desulfurase family protein [Nitrospirota bacterium]
MIYLDAVSAMPLRPEAVAAMQPFLAEGWGNPMSLHAAGDRPKAAIEEARADVAALIEADPREIIFTASGSESNNLAVKGIALALAARRSGRRHIIISAVEHPSVTAACQSLEARGFRTIVLPVDRHGRVDPAEIHLHLNEQTCLVSIQAASGEIGTIQPIAEIGAMTRREGILLHVDAVAAAGRIPIDVEAMKIDALSLSSNQLGGPPGAGALYVRRGVRLAAQTDGGIQERGRRAGLEAVPNIAGMGVAARSAKAELPTLSGQLDPLTRHLKESLKFDGWHLTGHPVERLPGHVSLVIEFVEGEALVMALSRDGVAAAAGTACRERTAWRASPTLLALGLDQPLAQGAVIFSLWRGNSLGEIDQAAKLIRQNVLYLRALSPLHAARRAEV